MSKTGSSHAGFQVAAVGFIKRCLYGVLLLAASDAGGAWFGLCGEGRVPPRSIILNTLMDPAGSKLLLLTAEQPHPECRMIDLPVSPDSVRWAQVLTRSAAQALGRGVMLQGVERGTGFAVSEVMPIDEPAAVRGPLPVAAELRLESLRPAAKAAGRALWVWNPAAWKAGAKELFGLLAANAADTVYVSVPLAPAGAGVADSDRLRLFVTEATLRGVRVWAVAGDPRALLPQERASYVARAQAYAGYNAGATPEARLAGVQFDIEPYLNPGYHIETEDWLAAYLDTLSLLKPAAGMPVDVAIPFWWGQQAFRGAAFLDHLAPLVDSVTVMNYRTNREQLLRFAEPFLAWGARRRRTVRIALEAGPIEDESIRIFRRAEAGELWLVALAEHSLVLLLDKAAPNPAGPVFGYSHTTPARGSNITFRNDLSALRELLPRLEAVWSAWPSFAGIALHGLDTP